MAGEVKVNKRTGEGDDVNRWTTEEGKQWNEREEGREEEEGKTRGSSLGVGVT